MYEIMYVYDSTHDVYTLPVTGSLSWASLTLEIGSCQLNSKIGGKSETLKNPHAARSNLGDSQRLPLFKHTVESKSNLHDETLSLSSWREVVHVPIPVIHWICGHTRGIIILGFESSAFDAQDLRA